MQGGSVKKLLVLITLALFVAAPTAFAVSPGQTRAQERAAARVEKAAEIKAQIEQLKEARAEEREQIKGQVVERIKTKALGEIDRIVARYEKIKNRVQKMKVISDERKTEVTTKIDAKIVELQSYKPQVEAATTAEEVRTIMKTLRTEVRKNANIVKEIVKAIHATHLDNIVTRLTEILTKLEGKGGDATLVATAKTQLTEATAIIKTGEFKAAKEKILEARKTMIEIAQKLKGGTETAEENQEEEAEQNTNGETSTAGEGQ